MVVGIDELATVFGDLPFVEHVADAPAAPAQPRARLEHPRGDAGFLQLVGGGEAREPGADHGDARLCRQTAQRLQAERCGGR